MMLYLVVALLGLVPLLVAAPPSWQTVGIGLWLPGGGFVAAGGWATLLFPLTVALFLAAIFAWFASGMVIAPIAIWLGSAVLAGAMTGQEIWQPAPFVVAVLTALVAVEWRRRNLARVTRDSVSARQRAAILPQALRDAADRAVPKPTYDSRELNQDELAGARYLLDRALQPVDEFGGFDCIDIFQTASVRYQINMMGYALSQLQQLYTPNFHGYLSLAQRNLIEKFLERRVWSYWIYESAWGHLNFTDWDPAAKDNIMLTGYYGAQVSLYMGNTGDMRYAVPGSLTFRLNQRKAWPHDVHTITRSVYDNSVDSAYCLYPCEPNWIYTGCNFRGMTTMVAHDRVFGTDFVTTIRDRWLQQLDREFTNAAGGLIGLRSSLTGIEFPFPSSELGYCTMANTFAPERAQEMWALVQFGMRRMLGEQDGKPIIMLPDNGIDFGNYQRGALTFAMGALQFAAHEFGDEELAAAAGNTLDLRCKRVEREGVVHYKGSNLANIAVAAGRFMRREDFRDVFVKGPESAAFTGPLLEEADYPDVLVSRAVSTGDDLDLIVVPGRGPGIQRLGLARLIPGRRYSVHGRPDLDFVADRDGRARIEFQLKDRTRLTVVPAE
jgi:hypothetical protein